MNTLTGNSVNIVLRSNLLLFYIALLAPKIMLSTLFIYMPTHPHLSLE